MLFYKITFRSMPEVYFAHKYHTSSYSLFFDNSMYGKQIEITYVEYGDLEFTSDNDSKVFYTEKTVNTNIYDRFLRGTSYGNPHGHITVGISGLFDIELVENIEMIKDFEAKPNVVLIPQTVPSDMSAKYKKCISDIVYNYTSGNILKATSNLFELFSLLTEYCLGYEKAKMGISTSDDLYCKKTKDYISSHIYEKISLSDISEHIGISTGYICRIFKKTENTSIVNYINKTKIDIATDILLTKDITTSELAGQLGIDDDKYFCRLFKKHSGKTVTEYKNSRD